MKRKPYMILLVLILAISLSCNTQSVVELIKTATPTPSHTPLPTFTPRPSQTPSPTLTATPVSAVSLVEQEDGDWLFMDYEGGYQFQMDKNWYLEDVSGMDVMEILAFANTLKEDLAIEGVPMYTIEPEGMRLLGVYLDDTVPDYMALSFNSCYLAGNDFADIPLEDMVNRVVNVLAKNYGYELEDFDLAMLTNDQGTEIGMLKYYLTDQYFQLKILFKVDNGFGMITQGMSDLNKESLVLDSVALINSIKVNNSYSSTDNG